MCWLAILALVEPSRLYLVRWCVVRPELFVIRSWQGTHTLFELSRVALALQALWKHLEQPRHHKNEHTRLSSVQ